ncbi:F-box/kelch-repeat protein At3g23880-like [Lotus japonicus]|uniref:F-box/kelch-repeat protein At3g23880-like n=1 Tax=Lotus japonicus TaxID=34305 RepID=UPI00258E03D5|nr:F-box/kelch-repeat protein At3g23880-like [Lotus japonicus]
MIFYCFLSFLLFLAIPSKMQKIQAFKLTLFRVPRPKKEIASMEQLPSELVSNILSRLPAKDLVKCKSVCKSWFNLISDPYFATNYYAFYNNLKHQQEPLFVIRRPFLSSLKTCISLLSSSVNHPHVSSELLNPPSEYNSDRQYWTEIMGPCNGIYYLKGSPNVLMNPSLRQLKALPASNLSTSSPQKTYSLTNYAGFGFDPKTNDYKVVVIKDLWFEKAERQNGHWTAELYSLNSNSWRNLDAALPLPFEIWGSSQVCTYVNNCCHWWGFVDECGEKQDVVLAFDMVTEVFRKIKVPRIRDSSGEASATLTPFNTTSTLGVIVHPVRGDVKGFDVWVMKDHCDEGSWMKQYSVGHREVIYKLVGFYGSHHFGSIEDNEGLVHNSKQIKDLQVYGMCESLRATRYMESLVSLHRGNEFSGQFVSCSSVPDLLPNQPRNYLVSLSQKMKTFLKM